jgi:cell division septum initiation protein DivIVA
MVRNAEEIPAEDWRGGEPVEAEPLPQPPPRSAGDLDALLDTRPCFHGQLRGYDRMQVDNYVAWAEDEIAAMRRQTDALLARLGATQAELEISRRLLDQSPRGRELSSASDRVGEMLRLAADESAAMTATAAEEADRMLAEARVEADARLAKVQEMKRAALVSCDEMREKARRDRAEAGSLLVRARKQAEEILTEAAARRDRLTSEAADARARLATMQEEVDDLRRQRDEARLLLRRLTEQISQALDAVTSGVPEGRIRFGRNVTADVPPEVPAGLAPTGPRVNGSKAAAASS